MASIQYEDGRVGLAAVVLRGFCAALDGVLGSITVSDADKAGDLSSAVSRASANTDLATTIDDIAALVVETITASRDIARLSSDADSAAAAWLIATGKCAALQASDTVSPATRSASRLSDAIAGCAEAACLGEYAIALSQGSFTDRPSALSAKQALSNAATGAVERIARVSGADVWEAITTAVERASDHLADRSLDLRPVVLVTTPQTMSASAMAWALYGETQRAAELVDRNRVGTPAFMPTTIEALAP